MDYVTNNTTIAKDKKADSAATLLAYDVAFAQLKNTERKEKKHV